MFHITLLCREIFNVYNYITLQTLKVTNLCCWKQSCLERLDCSEKLLWYLQKVTLNGSNIENQKLYLVIFEDDHVKRLLKWDFPFLHDMILSLSLPEVFIYYSRMPIVIQFRTSVMSQTANLDSTATKNLNKGTQYGKEFSLRVVCFVKFGPDSVPVSVFSR